MRGKYEKRPAPGKGRIALTLLCLFLAVLSGLGALWIPQSENREHAKKTNQEIRLVKEMVKVYREKVSETAQNEIQVFPELYAAMREYNEKIYREEQMDFNSAGAYMRQIIDVREYGLATPAVGMVSLPTISVELPLYLGGSYENMASGFAQLSQTSMPIGGENTNCVIAGHRGWKGMAYMRDVEQLAIGDPVYVENVWETLEYRIRSMKIIAPNEVECCYIEPGKDLLTIITCHPYGVGSHRIVVTCERAGAANDTSSAPEGEWVWEEQERVTIITTDNTAFESSQLAIAIDMYLPSIALSISSGILVLAAVILLLPKRKKKKPSTEPDLAP